MSAHSWNAARAEISRWIAERRNPDGGWGYGPGRPSRLEPTCWALLATRRPSSPADLEVLRRWKGRDGLPVEGPSGAINVAFAGLAGVTWLTLSNGEIPKELAGILSALARQRGVQLPQSSLTVQNNRLQGWPWVSSTFTWVEPTAWCLLALKRWRASGTAPVEVRERIDEGESVLLDRALPTGGWNYGNPLVYGRVLQAFVPTTALSLLALRDRRASRQVVEGVAWLTHQRLSEPSPSGLAWATLGLRAHGLGVTDLRNRLLVHVRSTRLETDIVTAAQVAEALAGGEEDDAFAV